MSKQASSPLALFAASSLASPLTPRRGSFTTRARVNSSPPRTSPLTSLPPPPTGSCSLTCVSGKLTPLVEPLEISSNSFGPAEGGDPTADDTAATRRSPRLETPPGFPPRPSSPPPQPAAMDSGAEIAGAEPGGAAIEGEGGAGSWGVATRGADSGGPASPSGGGAVGDLVGGPGAGQPPLPDLLETLSPQAIRAWIVRQGSPGGGGYGPAGVGAASPGGTAGAGGTGGTAGGDGGAAGAGGTRGAAGAGGAGATSPRGATGAGGTGPTSPGGTDGAGGAAGAGGARAGGAGAAGLGGARIRGVGAAGASGVFRAGGANGAAGSGGTGGTAGARGAGAARAGGTAGAGGAGGAGGATRAAGNGGAGGTAGAGGAGVGGTTGTEGARGTAGAAGARGARTANQSQPQLLLSSPLPAPAPHTEVAESLTERREPETRASTPVRACRVARPRPPAVPGTHDMALRPSSVPQRVVLPEPPASSLPHVPDPESDLACSASPTVTRLLATVVTDPDLESTAAFALVTEQVDFAARSRLDYVAGLVTESESVCPPSVGGELSLGSDVLEDRQFELKCLAAALPSFASILICLEGDPDALDIPTPRSYTQAIAGEYSSEWQTAMDAEMASWKSTGTYVDELPPPGANIVDGMWIFRVKRPPGSPPAFEARYVARGFSQRQGVEFFQTFSPTPKMTTPSTSLQLSCRAAFTRRSGCAAHPASLRRFLQVRSGRVHVIRYMRQPTSSKYGPLGSTDSSKGGAESEWLVDRGVGCGEENWKPKR
ncbi:unnamed protein product [Closterium sp. NIES-53]